MNKAIKHLALVAVIASGLGMAQAEAASISISIGANGISLGLSDNCRSVCHQAPKHVVHHNLRDRHHVDHCRECRDRLRRPVAQHKAFRKAMAAHPHNNHRR